MRRKKLNLKYIPKGVFNDIVQTRFKHKRIRTSRIAFAEISDIFKIKSGEDLAQVFMPQLPHLTSIWVPGATKRSEFDDWRHEASTYDLLFKRAVEHGRLVVEYGPSGTYKRDEFTFREKQSELALTDFFIGGSNLKFYDLPKLPPYYQNPRKLCGVLNEQDAI